ncbi:MAG TPA: LLM class flavin-dependent oxidoreductase [Mycobacteriales bacterium]
MARVPLSVLDLSPVSTGSTPADALRASTDLARTADALGYHRLWVAEHHNMPGIASTAPAVLIAHLAAVTERIRVGSGGVMLPNHPPLVVAEQFAMLEGLHPGRIDLGIGRAPGTDPRTAAALRRTPDGLNAEQFPQELVDLVAYLGRDTAPPSAGDDDLVDFTPRPGTVPVIWLLGSSGYSAQLAGLLGLPFSFAHHFSAVNTLPALELYRSRFRPSPFLAAPQAMVAVSVIVADTEAEARRLSTSGQLSFVRLRAGRPGTLPSPEEAEAYAFTEADRHLLAGRGNAHVAGDPEQVVAALERLQADTAADELMVTTMVHDPAARLHSYELLAKAWF